MKLKSLIFFLFVFSICKGQNSSSIRRDTSIQFNSGSDYQTRSVPYDSDFPTYILLSYDGDGKNPHYEFFRIDSTRYLVYEYFKSGSINTGRGIKSRGIKVVGSISRDSSFVDVFDKDGNKTSKSVIAYHKNLLKEALWREFEDDDGDFYIYWEGLYKNGKRKGIWKRLVNRGDILEEINYDTDSTKKIFHNNIVNNMSIDSLKKNLVGRWTLGTCDHNRRMPYYKCQTFNGAYGDDCNNRHGKQNYYEFYSSAKFVRQRGEGCHKFMESALAGNWKLKESGGKRYIEIKFTNGQLWRFEIIYFDNKNNFITERV